MAKLIDAERLLQQQAAIAANCAKSNAQKALMGRVIFNTENQPAVDAVPVVRCRECRYWRQEVSPTEHWVCAHHSFNERKMYTTPVFYCADGERRDEDG